ncbi:MAG: tRNA (N(6)-L-threonylcarbamoyladenosine(37)-C(2))-methylthiotransferase MtaB [Bacteroidales bacterium]|nr:tRNA (N(6)-L-threonylcarbamoyladenosine(37)-C(2))-methylthiotransferase MtaB [Bacteroidales bacterium]
MKKTRIAYITLGCKLNYAETSTYERAFAAAGLETVPWSGGKADVYLVNSCSVTSHADQKCRGVIRKLHRLSPGAMIVVTGCYAQLKREEVAALEGVGLVFGAAEKHLLVPSVLRALGHEEMPAQPDGNGCFPAFSSGEDRTRAFLKVQDGCDYKCAYCTVPYARGESRNIPLCQAVRQAEEIADAGVREIVLTGVNTGDFGRSTGESFFDLLKALNEVKGIERYRISSIEPNLLTTEIIDWIASGTKFLPHFHIPLQSGSDEILKRMGRRYDTAFFASRIDYIRSKMEKEGGLKVFFGIDLIAGLPGESDELFEETYKFLRDRVKPAFIHVFPYSKRPGTPAAAMKDQVRDGVKTERVARLEKLCSELHEEFCEAHRGMKSRVLFESKESGGLMSGYTENYIKVSVPYDEKLVGTTVEMEI